MERWEFLTILIVVLPIMALWIGCIIDVIRRHDLSGVTKVLWLLAILFFPLFGSLIYVIARPNFPLDASYPMSYYTGWSTDSIAGKSESSAPDLASGKIP